MTKGKLAIVASLAAHVVLAGFGWLWPMARPDPAQRLDTQAADDGREYQLFFEEEEERTVAVTLAPPAPAAPEPPVESVPTEPAEIGVSAQATAAIEPAPAGGVPGTAGHSGTGSATFFQIPVEGRSVVFVIDRSSSMSLQGRWTAARRELLASLDRLPATARFQILVFNSRVEPFRLAGADCLVPATAENKARAAAFLQSLPPEGGTAHLPAFRSALALEPDQVFFLTDADDLKAEEVRLVTQLNRGRTAIHTVEMTLAHRGRADMPLQVLARTNRGSYRAVAVAP